MEEKKPIRSFRDLLVYQNTYKSMLIVFDKVLPHLPDQEKYDLKDQLQRATKSIPRLIAEGYAKRHQKLGFQKYLDDAMAECNETIVSLEQSRDLYGKNIDKVVCGNPIKENDISGRQIYKLAESWSKFKRREGFGPNPNHQTKPAS